MTALADAAFEYAEDGWAVFPVKPRGKIPACEHGVKDATKDLAVVEATWHETPEANIGLATGSVSGIVAVDLDGDDGVETWKRITAENGGHVPTRTARTGSGGWHLLYALPEGTTVRNTARRLGPGVDTRGDGGYIVAAPSIHPSGGIYAWANDLPLANVPPWLLAQLVKREETFAPPAPRDYGDAVGSRYGKAALDRILDELRQATPGGRNDALNTAAFSVGRLVAGGELDGLASTDALVATGKDLGLGEHEVQATVASGLRSGYERPKVRPA